MGYGGQIWAGKALAPPVWEAVRSSGVPHDGVEPNVPSFGGNRMSDVQSVCLEVNRKRFGFIIEKMSWFQLLTLSQQ